MRCLFIYRTRSSAFLNTPIGKVNMKVEKWVFIEALGGDKWISSIWSAIHSAEREGKLLPLKEDELELGGSIPRKLTMIPTITKRLYEESRSLLKEVKRGFNPTCIYTKDNNGKHTIPVNNDLKFQLLCDTDVFLFETNSCCELIIKFFHRIFVSSGMEIGEKDMIDYFIDVIKRAGGKTKWFKDLDRFRNIFSHNKAPYIAVDYTNSQNPRILVMAKIKQKFEDEKGYISTERFNEIYEGFEEEKAILKEYIINYLGSL